MICHLAAGAAHVIHRRVAGSAASRALAIGLPHISHPPYWLSWSRASASSTSVKCACAWASNAASCSRSKAMVEPSGSCSSSRLLPTEAAATDARSAVMDEMRCEVAACSAVSRASASSLFTSPVSPPRNGSHPARRAHGSFRTHRTPSAADVRVALNALGGKVVRVPGGMTCAIGGTLSVPAPVATPINTTARWTGESHDRSPRCPRPARSQARQRK